MSLRLRQNTFSTFGKLPTTKLVFIDSQVENYQSLAAGAVSGAEVVIVESNCDGIVQISEVLRQRSHIREVHIVSHGSPGCLYLGNTQLSLDTLDKYREELKTWFSSPHLPISPSPLLFLYGCNVAAGDAGEEFIAKLHDITGSEIAASATRTGNAIKGGNWNFEYRTANIAAENAFSLQTQNFYTGILAYILVDNKTSGTLNNTTTTTNPLVRTFNVANNVTVNNLALGLNVTHARRGDLLFTLTSPDGTTVTAVANGSDANTNYDLLLQDGSANPINDGTTDTIAAPIYSADRIAAPSNPFSAFNGKSAQGTWTLRIADTVPASNNGTFNSARLTLNLPTSLNFQNPTLVSGTNLQPGSVYRFSNVLTGVDALVTVTAFNGGATLAAIDSTANGTAAAFQPEVSVPANAANASVDFAFSFVNSGTATQTTVSDFLLSPIDVDGDNVAIREYVELSNISAYTIETGSNLTTTYTSATETTRFEARTNAVVAGIDPSVTANIATAQYGGVKSFTYKAGALNNGANTQTRLFSLAANSAYANNYVTPVTTTVNQTPVLDLDANNSTTTASNYITSYTENATGVSIGDTDTTITDADDTNIEFAVIILTNPQASDLLAIGSLPGGITGTYDSATQTVTLTGSATLANYQTAIRAVTFSNTSDNPSTTPRTVNVVVNDGETNSNTATTTINVTAVNDPPVIDLDGSTAGANYTTTFTEKGSAVAIANTNISITDPDNTNISSAAITLTNAQASDLLTIGTLPTGISGTYNSGTQTVTLTGSATLANYQTAIRAVTFSNTSNNPSTTPRTVNVVVNDGSANSNTATTTINVTAVNDPPVIDLDGSTAGANYTTTFTEKGSAVAIANTNISITDPDNTNISSAAITLTNAQASDLLTIGTLPTGISGTYNSGTQTVTLTGSATLANYQTAIRAVTFSNTSNNPSTTPRTVNVVVNDGSANSNTATTTINVTAVNDPPVIDLDGSTAGANYTTTFTEKGSAVAIANTNISITDPDNTNISSAAITLTNAQASDLLTIGTLPTGISGTYNSGTQTVTLTGSATLANYQTAIRAVTFSNTSDNPSTTPRTVNVVVNDGSANSNTATATTTINVTAVNDPPIIDLNSTADAADSDRGFAVTYTEKDDPINIVDSDADAFDAEDNITSMTIVVSDILNPGAEYVRFGNSGFLLSTDVATPRQLTFGSTTFNITYNYNDGNGGSFSITDSNTANPIIPEADLDTLLQNITYRHDSDNPDAGDRTLTFTATDAEGATSDSAVSTVTVDSVPDAVADTNSATEAGSAISDSVLTNDDLGDAPTTVTAASQGANTITLDNAFTTANDGSLTLNSDGSYSYTPPAQGQVPAGGISEVFNYTITDRDGDTSSTTLTIDVKDRINGTSGSDDLTSQATAGDDYFIGYEGQDTLTGGGGNDQFVYTKTSDGIDIITDFDPTDGDKLDFSDIVDGELSGITFPNNPFDDGYVEAVNFGTAGVIIQVDVNPSDTLENKNVVLLKNDVDGISINDIDASDFIF